MSRFSPTVLPQPIDYGAPLRDALQAFLVARGIRDQRQHQQQQDARQARLDAENAQQREFANRLAEQAQSRADLQGGITRGGDVAVPSGALAEAFGRQIAGLGVPAVAGAAGPAPTTTVTTPDTYDYTKSASYQQSQAAAERGLADALLKNQLGEPQRAETHRHNVAMERAANLRASRTGSGSGTPGADVRTANAKEQYFQRVAANAVAAAKGDPQKAVQYILDHPETRNIFNEGMDARQVVAAAQAFRERPAVRSSLFKDLGLNTNGGAQRDSTVTPVRPAQPVQRAPQAQPETQPVSPDAAYMRAITKQAQDAITMIDGSRGGITPTQALRSPNLTDEAKAIIARHYGVAASDTATATGGAAR